MCQAFPFFMHFDLLIIGGGAAGLMAAYSAAHTLAEKGAHLRVAVLEKMPRPGRKIMITGKGRCNFTNVKDWNAFSGHIRSNPAAVKPAFFNFTPENSLAFFEHFGMPSVIERGDRAYPASYRSSDVVDALTRACISENVKILAGAQVSRTRFGEGSFALSCEDGRSFECSFLIVATGGLSYPATGSTGDGYRFAEAAGHSLTPLFPSLTALVPKGYKMLPENPLSGDLPHHIDRSLPLSGTGRLLCGVSLKNVGVQLLVEGTSAQTETGELSFTDGGLEGPVGFGISRKAVKALINGSRVSVALDLKPAVPAEELTRRIMGLWSSVNSDARSRTLSEKAKYKIVLSSLLPRELIPAFAEAHRDFSPAATAGALKEWKFEIGGYVGYERAVVTAGGVDTGEIVAKTLESKKRKGLYFCGEVLDIDADTGGYNIHLAFATGKLAGESAAKALLASAVGAG